jgi:hypothetical protein
VNSQLVAVEIPGNNKVTSEFKYENRLLLLYVMFAKACAHLKQVNQNIKAKTPNGCEECLKMGSGWVHLRLCLTCGHVVVVILLLINMQQNIPKQLDIQS